MTGQVFGKLTVVEFDFVDKYRQAHWLCKCECGNLKSINGKALRCGDTRSCGCINLERIKTMSTIKHNCHGTRLYKAWANMKTRCLNPNASGYTNYGGRGISVCNEWQEFVNFKNWALLAGYKDNLSIDRIDVNGNYEPSNCRWVSMKTQANNKTTSHFITFKNETKTLSQWADVLGVKADTLKRRIYLGWSIEKAFITPLRSRSAQSRCLDS